MTEVKPKAKSRKSADWDDALNTYKGSINDRKDLVGRLEHYRDGCSDAEWIIIHRAIASIKVKIEKMQIFLEHMRKKNES